MARSTAKESWKDLGPTERWSVLLIIALVIAQATAVVTAVKVDGPNVKGGLGPRLLAMLVNYESDSVHIVSQPLLWVSRVLLVAIVGACVLSVRATKRRHELAATDVALDSGERASESTSSRPGRRQRPHPRLQPRGQGRRRA